MNVNYINPFIQASKSVLESVLGVEIRIDRPRVSPIVFEDTAEIVLIGITGEVKGQIFLGFNKAVACRIAGAMMYMEVAEMDELAESALSELCNMIMGNTATVFSQTNIRIDITPPTLARGSILSFDTQGVEHILLPVCVGDIGVIDMHIALKK